MKRPLRLTLKEGLNFRRRNVKERVFDGGADKVILSKIVAHFSLNFKYIKRTKRNESAKVLEGCTLGIFECHKEL